MLSLGSSRPMYGARIAPSTTNAIHAIASQPPKPRPLRRALISGPDSTAAISMVPASTGIPRSAASSTKSRSASGCSRVGTTDPRIEYDVERVDQEVQEEVVDRDDRAVTLQLDELARG